MRTSEEIREKVHDLCRRRLKERKEEYLGRSPINCVHNERHRVRKAGKIGFCQNEKVVETSRGYVVVCNDEGTATGCGSFECRNTEESVTSDFMEVLKNPSRCGQEYPKLAILLWCLQEDGAGNGVSTRSGRFVEHLRAFGLAVCNVVTFKWW